MTERDCSTCKHAERGLMSGMDYCTACPDERWPMFTHQMRLEGSPCGPEGRLFGAGLPSVVPAEILPAAR